MFMHVCHRSVPYSGAPSPSHYRNCPQPPCTSSLEEAKRYPAHSVSRNPPGPLCAQCPTPPTLRRGIMLPITGPEGVEHSVGRLRQARHGRNAHPRRPSRERLVGEMVDKVVGSSPTCTGLIQPIPECGTDPVITLQNFWNWVFSIRKPLNPSSR